MSPRVPPVSIGHGNISEGERGRERESKSLKNHPPRRLGGHGGTTLITKEQAGGTNRSTTPGWCTATLAMLIEMGEISQELEKSKPDKGHGAGLPSGGKTKASVLAEAGISKKQAYSAGSVSRHM